MFPSKEQVTCFYCDWNGRRDKAKDHCKKQHPDKKLKLKMAENNMEKFFQKQVETDKTTATTDVADADEQRQDEQNSIVISPCLSSLNTSHMSTPSSVSACISPTPNSISDQLASMSEQLKKITGAIEQINLDKAKSQATSSSPSDDLEKMFLDVKCSNDLLMLKHLEIDIQSDLITCIPCSKFKKQAAKHLLNMVKSSFGMFEYIEQDAHQNQSQRFRNLKQSLKVHYSNKLHIWCVEKDEHIKQECQDFLRRNKKSWFKRW